MLLGQAARLRKRQGNLPGRAYLSAGTEDSESMLGDLELLEDQLSSRPFAQLAVTFERIAGRNHYDVLPEAVRAGLRSLLPADAAPAKSRGVSRRVQGRAGSQPWKRIQSSARAGHSEVGPLPGFRPKPCGPF